MDMLKLAGFAICAALMAMLLRRMKPEAGIGVSLAAGVLLLAFITPWFQQAVQGIAQIAQTGGISDTYMKQLLKVGGISLLMDFAAQTCRDAGEDGLAMKVELAGRAALIAVALPYMEALLQQIMSLAS